MRKEIMKKKKTIKLLLLGMLLLGLTLVPIKEDKDNNSDINIDNLILFNIEKPIIHYNTSYFIKWK